MSEAERIIAWALTKSDSPVEAANRLREARKVVLSLEGNGFAITRKERLDGLEDFWDANG